MIDEGRKLEIMREAIAQARLCSPADPRLHPRVGAVLTDTDGKILYRSHRNEGNLEGHAEFLLLEKARLDGFNVEGTVLFSSLEPCTRRGIHKVPCAVRVAESGIKRVYIGTLDPNPHITGRGSMFLTTKLEVEHFPFALGRELMALNQEFFNHYAHNHVPAVSVYAGWPAQEGEPPFRPVLAGQREGLLQQSLDLISGTSGDVLIFAGDLSWLRELQITIVLAKLSKRRVRILCDKTTQSGKQFVSSMLIATALGADVGVIQGQTGVRGTLVSPATVEAAMICIERRPALHGLLFQAPHELGVIGGLAQLFESNWTHAEKQMAMEPRIESLHFEAIVEALRTQVPAYRNASIELVQVELATLKPLARFLERFKLSRLNQLAILSERFGVRFPAAIQGSPWAIIPPIVEEAAGGEFAIVDGTHRVYSALSRGLDRLEVLLVRGVTEPLPAKPLENWDQTQLVMEKRPRNMRYENYSIEYFRPIRAAINVVAGF
jgi:pyrimidine deaminase RibD-like protein